jgi:hypothetical protein
MVLVAQVKLTTGSKKKEKGEQRITLHCSPFTHLCSPYCSKLQLYDFLSAYLKRSFSVLYAKENDGIHSFLDKFDHHTGV